MPFFKHMVYMHTQDKPIEVFSGWKFSLDIPTPVTIDLLKLVDEVKAAMSNTNQTGGNKFSSGTIEQEALRQLWAVSPNAGLGWCFPL